MAALSAGQNITVVLDGTDITLPYDVYAQAIIEAGGLSEVASTVIELQHYLSAAEQSIDTFWLLSGAFLVFCEWSWVCDFHPFHTKIEVHTPYVL